MDAVQEVYQALAGVDRKGRGCVGVSMEEESEEPRETVSAEEYKRRVMSYLSPAQKSSLGFQLKAGFGEGRPVSGQSNVSRGQYLGGQIESNQDQLEHSHLQNQSQIPILDQNELNSSYMPESSVNGQSDSRMAFASQSQKKRVKFDKEQPNGSTS